MHAAPRTPATHVPPAPRAPVVVASDHAAELAAVRAALEAWFGGAVAATLTLALALALALTLALTLTLTLTLNLNLNLTLPPNQVRSHRRPRRRSSRTCARSSVPCCR